MFQHEKITLIFSFSARPHVSNVLRDQWVQMGRGGSLDKKRTSRRIFQTSGRMGKSKDHLSNISHWRRQNAAQISLKMFSGQISNRDANTSVAKSKLKSEKSMYPGSRTPDLWMNWKKHENVKSWLIQGPRRSWKRSEWSIQTKYSVNFKHRSPMHVHRRKN